VVDLTMTLSTSGPRPKAALAALHGKQGPLVSALRDAGVVDADLRLGHVDVAPVYKPHPQSHLVDGYEASITLVATLHDFARIGDVMEAAADHDVSRIHTRFRSTTLTEKKKEVREMALAAARDKAQQIAKSMGVELAGVLSVSELAGSSTPWAIGNENAYAPVARDEILQPGAIELSLTLEVAYRLR
jgi:hypothetical protein